MKTKIKRLCKQEGFKGKVIFKPTSEWQKFNLAKSINRIVTDLDYDVIEACNDANRDLFENIVFYIAPQSFYHYMTKFNRFEKWTKGEINGLRKAVGPCSKLPRACIEELQDKAYCHSSEFKITKEQSLFGIEYLKKTVFTKKGIPRNAKRNFLRSEPNAIKIIKNFAKFRFIGLQSVPNNYYWGNRAGEYTLPIYRTYDRDGNYFDYTAGMWGNCELINLNYQEGN